MLNEKIDQVLNMSGPCGEFDCRIIIYWVTKSKYSQIVNNTTVPILRNYKHYFISYY